MRFWFLIGCFSMFFSLHAQKEKAPNYKKFDERLVHFGFMLGVNMANFNTFQKLDAYSQFGLKSLVSKSQPGGQVGIVSTLKLGTPTVRLRFLPTLSFQERVLKYTFVNPDPNATEDLFLEERVNSTNLDFPLMLQFRTLRLNNFAAYVFLGGQYSLDLQSREKASQDLIDPFIKIRKNDIQGQIGLGVEFFAEYFKFGMEVKYSQGFKNSFIQDFTPSSNPINKLYNNVVWISLIFEG
jgi:hypothetical protein